MRWELLDAAFIADASDGFEFGFVLRRAAGDATPDALAQHLRLSWQALAAKARQRTDSDRQMARLRAMPGFPFAQRAWRMQRCVRDSIAKR
jgi:hypothetical protein